MNGSPPRMPKKAFPCCLASVIVRLRVSRSMLSFSSTSTQQPWQRRLHELMTERYRNGGKYSPRLTRRLNFSTDHIPFAPKFQVNFHKQRLSVVRRMRVAREANMTTSGRRPRSSGNSGAFINPVQPDLHAYAGELEEGIGPFEQLALPTWVGAPQHGHRDAVLFDQNIRFQRRDLAVGDGLLAAIRA